MVYEGNAWLGYDRRFRQAVAVNPQMQWSRTDTDLWHLAFTSMIKRPRCAHCSSLTHKSAHCGWAQDSPERTTSAPNSGSWYYSQADPKPYYSGICRFWNRDPRLGCLFPNCKFQHICSFCSRHQLNTQSWGNLVTCNLSYVIFITFQVKSNITKLLFSQVICNLIILLSEVILLFVYSSYVKLLLS